MPCEVNGSRIICHTHDLTANRYTLLLTLPHGYHLCYLLGLEVWQGMVKVSDG